MCVIEKFCAAYRLGAVWIGPLSRSLDNFLGWIGRAHGPAIWNSRVSLFKLMERFKQVTVCSLIGPAFLHPNSGEHEGSRRMKTELFVQMDGLARSSDLVFLLAASNLPWCVLSQSGYVAQITSSFPTSNRELDHAMLRRLEKRILVNLPTEEARMAMFSHHLPPVLSREPLHIQTEIDYKRAAQVEKEEQSKGTNNHQPCVATSYILCVAANRRLFWVRCPIGMQGSGHETDSESVWQAGSFGKG